MADIQSPYIHRFSEKNIMELRISRPDKKNALNLEMYDTLANEISQAEQNPDVSVLIISGEKNNFTAGNDLGDFLDAHAKKETEDMPVLRFMKALRDFSKPVIACVDGIAIGIGTTMLLHCDFVYASEGTTFQLPFTRLGLCPEYGSSLLLPKLAGHVKAMEWLLLGVPFSASEASSAGLINQVVENPLQQARTVAEIIVTLPPQATITTKALLKKQKNADICQAMSDELEAFTRALKGEEFAKAAMNFFQNRKQKVSL